MTRFFMAALLAIATTAPLLGQETVIGLTTQNGIEIFDSGAPNISLDAGFVGGDLAAGEVLLGIDYRPATGDVYAIGNQDNVYTIDLNTFDATLVGNFADPRLRGNSFGFDFNPAFHGMVNSQESSVTPTRTA